MRDQISKKCKESLRFTMACFAGNVALSEQGLPCQRRLKENMTFLRDFMRRGLTREALGCMVENVFLGDLNDCRHAAVIRWYDRKHPGTGPLIVTCLDEMADISNAAHTVGRIRNRLHVPRPAGKGKKPHNKLKKVEGCYVLTSESHAPKSSLARCV